jgi:hypothetical protein
MIAGGDILKCMKNGHIVGSGRNTEGIVLVVKGHLVM